MFIFSYPFHCVLFLALPFFILLFLLRASGNISCLPSLAFLYIFLLSTFQQFHSLFFSLSFYLVYFRRFLFWYIYTFNCTFLWRSWSFLHCFFLQASFLPSNSPPLSQPSSFSFLQTVRGKVYQCLLTFPFACLFPTPFFLPLFHVIFFISFSVSSYLDPISSLSSFKCILLHAFSCLICLYINSFDIFPLQVCCNFRLFSSLSSFHCFVFFSLFSYHALFHSIFHPLIVTPFAPFLQVFPFPLVHRLPSLFLFLVCLSMLPQVLFLLSVCVLYSRASRHHFEVISTDGRVFRETTAVSSFF